MMDFKRLFFCLTYLLIINNISAQTYASAHPSSTILKGQMTTQTLKPISGMQILLIGIEQSSTTQTDSNGRFEMQIPKDFKLEKGSFSIVFDARKTKGRADYDLIMKGKDSLHFIVYLPPQTIKEILIKNEKNILQANTALQIDDTVLISDINGKVNSKGVADELCSFLVKGFWIENIQLDFASQILTLQIRPLEFGEKSQAVYLNHINDRFLQRED